MIFFLNNKFILFKCHILIALNLQSQKQYLQLDNGVKVSVQVLIMGSCSGSGQTKDYKIGIFCFSVKYAALRRKSKDWLWISIMCESNLVRDSSDGFFGLAVALGRQRAIHTENSEIFFFNSWSAHFHVSWLSDFIFYQKPVNI